MLFGRLGNCECLRRSLYPGRELMLFEKVRIQASRGFAIPTREFSLAEQQIFEIYQHRFISFLSTLDFAIVVHVLVEFCFWFNSFEKLNNCQLVLSAVVAPRRSEARCFFPCSLSEASYFHLSAHQQSRHCLRGNNKCRLETMGTSRKTC
jgi:hypothetical protein